MDVKVVTALIAGGASLVITVLGQIFNPISQRRLEKQKAELQREIEQTKAKIAERTSAAAARRDYEYEALKRLYAEVEPLFFQLYESVEECYYRIVSLARTSRQGHLGVGQDSWIDRDGYYLRSTAYKCILPRVMFHLIQRRMTFIDLKLDEVLRLRYLLLKNLIQSFVDHFEFAALSPALEYEPDWENQNLQAANPAMWRPQGFVKGDLENLIDELVVSEGGAVRACSFGEFEKHIHSAGHKDSLVGELIALYRGFASETHPVLTRMLLAQAGLCSLFMATYRMPVDVQSLRRELDAFCSSQEVLNLLRWKANDDLTELKTVRGYLVGCLDRIERAP